MNPIFVPRIDRIALRTDQSKVDPATGYLHIDGTSSLVGVLEYGLADGAPSDDHFEFVPRSTLSDPTFLAAMTTIPVTMGHPPVMLDATNTDRYAVGWVKRAWMDGDRLRVSMVITKDSAIRAIQDGVNQLSLGYHVRLEEKPGTFQGKPYRFVQAERLPNHQGVVDVARAGPSAKVDRADGRSLGGWTSRMDALRVSTTRQDTNMDEVEVEIGGVRYMVPAPVASALNAANEKAGAGGEPTGDADPPSNPPAPTQSGDEGNHGNDRDRGDGRRNGGRQRSDGSPGVTHEELEAWGTTFLGKLDERLETREGKRDAAAKARAELVAAATPVLPNSYKFDGKSDADVMLDAICEAQPDLKTEAEAIRGDAAALGGMFRAAVKLGKRDSSTGTKLNQDAHAGDPVEAARERQAQRRRDASHGTVTSIAEARKRNDEARRAAAGKGGK